jgi:hypothetical protein
MLTKKQIEDAGYTLLPEGGWMYVDPEIVPRDWYDLSKKY